MATKADFTESEWEQLHNGVTGAGLLVSLVDRSFFDNFKEARAIAKHLNDARQHSDSLLVRDLAAEHGTGFSMRPSRRDRAKDAGGADLVGGAAEDEGAGGPRRLPDSGDGRGRVGGGRREGRGGSRGGGGREDPSGGGGRPD